MFLDLTASQVALRDELRAYFATRVSADERASMLSDRHNAAYRAVPLGEHRLALVGRDQRGEIGPQLVAQRDLLGGEVEEHGGP